MEEKEKLQNCTLWYCDKPIDLSQPLVSIDLSCEQSDDEKAKWDNLCCQTIEFTTSVHRIDKRLKNLLYGKKWGKIPRKLKKRIKRDCYHGYFCKRLSRWKLLCAYLSTNPRKRAWLKQWNVEYLVKKRQIDG